ncbi:hypothetical protein ACN47E_007671 [Coniothyrium glycines]
MIMEARYQELREKMQVIKDLYKSRHYTQCAKYGERLLGEVQSEIHPIHLAYLNFYTALSYDTLAREATLKNRYKSLKQAEQHYTAAIAALAPTYTSSIASDTEYDRDQHSPAVSPTTSRTWQRRSAYNNSFDSTTSAASSTTSCSTALSTPKQLADYHFPSPPSSRPHSPEEYHFATSTSSFLMMLQSHLVSVRELKERTQVPVGVRFAFPSPPETSTTPVSAGLKNRASKVFDLQAEDREEVKRKRKERVWRKRFDPEGVRRLCSEALGELS